MKKLTKKQHYVPQFYLKNFVEHGTKIWVYDKKERKSIGSNIGDIAQERYFYELPVVNGAHEDIIKDGLNEKTIVEDALAEFDRVTARTLQQIVGNIEASKYISKTGSIIFQPSVEQKLGLSFFAALQDMRTKEMREMIGQMNYLMTHSLLEMIGKEKFSDFNIDDFQIETDETRESLMHSQLVLNEEMLEGIARVCAFGRIWCLGVNNTQTPLMISDHPIVKRSYHPNRFIRGVGWKSSYVEIGIPLTPKYIALLYCPLMMKGERKFGEEWKMNNTIANLNKENVLYYNSLQWSHSNRFVYSPTNEWSIVEDYLTEFPEHSNPIRQKVEVGGFGRNRKLPPDWRTPKNKI